MNKHQRGRCSLPYPLEAVFHPVQSQSWTAHFVYHGFPSSNSHLQFIYFFCLVAAWFLFRAPPLSPPGNEGCSANKDWRKRSEIIGTVGGLGSEARFQVKKSACFWCHGRYQDFFCSCRARSEARTVIKTSCGRYTILTLQENR